MENCTYGKMIRERRQQLGLTQKQLAHNLCAISTISRIENEGRNPSRALFDEITMRLGGSGRFSYELCFTKNEWASYGLKRQIIEALCECNEDKLNEKIECYLKVVDISDKRERQFLQMIYLIDIGDRFSDYETQRAIIDSSLMLLGISEEELNNATFIRRKMTLTRWEFFVFNNMAISYLEIGMYEASRKISIFLFQICKRTVLNHPTPSMTEALICNNLAVINFHLGEIGLGLKYYRYGYEKMQLCTSMKIQMNMQDVYQALIAGQNKPVALRTF